MSADLAGPNVGAQLVDVIVQYAVPPDFRHAAKALKHGAMPKKDLGMMHAQVYTIPADQVGSLADDDSDITYITPDRPVMGAATGFTNSFVAVNADLAQSYGYDGTNIGVAVIDSGIGATPDLDKRVVYQQDFTGQGNDDQYGHGTHIAGIIGGNGKNSTCATCFVTYKGIAPNVKLVNLKALDRTGAGTDSNVIAAIQTAIQLKSKFNIRIINLSLGRGIHESYATDPLTQAVEQAWNAGIFVVVAAGNYGRDNSNNNSGYGTITSPGNDPLVITVGAMRTMGTATRTDDGIASYSSKGPTMLDHVVKPDIVAPGNLIQSILAGHATLDTTYPTTLLPFATYQTTTSTNMSNVYFTLSGTSMAAPMVSGAAALMLQKDPTLTPDQLKARLMKTAFKALPLYTTATDVATGVTYNEQADIFTVGAGYLDVAAALNSTDAAPTNVGAALSPSVQVNSSGDTYLVNGNSIIWGNSVMWGNSVLWGNSVVWGNSVIWGNNTAGQSVLWGNSVVWGNSTTSAYSVIWGNSTSCMSVLWGNSSTSSDATSVLAGGDQ